jgi:PAS domain S-box-containing protein
MTEAGKISGGYPTKKWAMLMAMIAGLLFPFTSVLVIILRSEVLFNLKSIFTIHIGHPELFILYLLPFIGAYLVHIFFTRLQQNQLNFQKIINEKNEIINRNVHLAKEISKGNYNVHIIPEGEQDALGKFMRDLKENLMANDRKESTQNWIYEGKNEISNILRLHHKLEELGDHILEFLVKYIDAIQGAIYLYHEKEDSLVSLSTYAYFHKKNLDQSFKVGHGLIGQCAYEKEYIYRTKIPDDYFTISSGLLGEQKPTSLLIVPLINDDTLQGVMEIAFLSPEIPEQTIDFVKELGEMISRTICNLRVNQRTEKLLLESKEITLELKSNEKKLKKHAEELRVSQEALKRSYEQLAAQLHEVENAHKRLHCLLENASEIMTIYDKDLKNIYVSPSVARILGFSQKEYMNGKDFERLKSQDRERIRELFNMIIKDPSITPSIQYNYIRKDGQQVALESTLKNMLEDPAVNGIMMNISMVSS